VLAPATAQVFNPQGMIRRSVVGFKVNDNVLGGVTVNALEEANSTINRKLSMIAAATDAEALNPLPDVCGTGPRCLAFFGDGKPKFADQLHLRPEFVAHHIRIFDRVLTDRSAR
jgi:hypothetical protein